MLADFNKVNASVADRALLIALSFLWVREATGENDGPETNMFQEYVGGKSEHGEPWCACFRSYCLGNAHDIVKSQTKNVVSDSSTAIYAWAKTNNLVLTGPIIGCTGLLKGDGGNGSGKTHHHTFAVLSVDIANEVVWSVDGNWQNGVRITSHKISDCDFVGVL